ncbi:MAG TPA: hypothetical protein VIC32_00485, partial [Terriglobales bacterium]
MLRLSPQRGGRKLGPFVFTVAFALALIPLLLSPPSLAGQGAKPPQQPVHITPGSVPAVPGGVTPALTPAPPNAPDSATNPTGPATKPAPAGNPQVPEIISTVSLVLVPVVITDPLNRMV